MNSSFLTISLFFCIRCKVDIIEAEAKENTLVHEKKHQQKIDTKKCTRRFSIKLL